MFFYVAVTIVITFLVVFLFKKKNTEKELISSLLESKYWSLNENEKDDDDSVRKFSIEVSKEEIESLKNRLLATKWSLPSISTTNSTYGIRDSTMKKVVSYWTNNYDWSEREKMLNSFDHFKTKIEGLDVHFVHSKSKVTSLKSTPILMTHGWPGSFVEFCKIIPMLTDPENHGATDSDGFDVVCASIPGYGFSDAPQKEGFNAFECARVFHKLMIRLGYNKYVVQGGDWGALVSTAIATLYPENVIGIHINMMASSGGNGKEFARMMAGTFYPTIFYPPLEANKLFPLKDYITNLLVESGYLHLQATKPDTVGFALTDSPVGLAAYLLEKFSSWTDMESRNTDDGMLERYFSLDELLDNIMVYWINGNITSSMRFYKENTSNGHEVLTRLAKLEIKVPSGYAWFPNEVACASSAEVKEKFTNMVHFTYMEEGGHFGAFQVPSSMAREIREFARKIK